MDHPSHTVPLAKPTYLGFRHVALAIVATLTAALGCESMQTGAALTGQSATGPTYLRAELRVRGWLIDYLARAPRGHGYQRGDFVAFYRPLATEGASADPAARLAVGYGQVQSAEAQTLVIAMRQLPADQRARTLDIRELPNRANFQQYLGQVLAVEVTDEHGGLFRINIGDSDGVQLRDQYQVLGAVISDAGVDGRSLGREVIGQMEVVELPAGKSFARARLVAGRAPVGHWLEWSGRNPNPIGDDKYVTILATPFAGDAGDVYSKVLYQRLGQLARKSKGTIVIERWPHVITTTDVDRIRAIGRQKGAHLVVWGEGRDDRVLAGSGKARGWITPRLTFVHPNVSGEEDRMWDEIKMPLAKVAENTAYKERHISGLAYRLVGMAHYRRDDYTGAIHFLERAARTGEPADQMAARIPLFWAHERSGSWQRAEDWHGRSSRMGKQ